MDKINNYPSDLKDDICIIYDRELIYPINDLKLENISTCASDWKSVKEGKYFKDPFMIHYWIHGDFESKNLLNIFKPDINQDVHHNMYMFFYLLYNSDSNKLYKQQTIKYSEKIEYLPNLLKINKLKNFKKDTQINLGLVSGDFRKHPVGYFLLDILNHLKNHNIKLFGYSDLEREDDYTASLKQKFDLFNNISSFSNKDCATQIFSDKIDILIDMSGYSNQTRLPLFKQKVAPIQVSWAAWLATTGIEEIDYIIGDPIVTPEEHKDFYIEKILQLPNIWCHLSTSDIKQISTSHTPAIDNNYITFGSFNNMNKIYNKVIEVWSQILSLVLNSKILISSKVFD
jgi:predicted O-linked N-acetylglucosamine transferase (SPINDLY family)